MFIRVCGGRKKSEKFVSTKGTISVTTNITGAAVEILDGTTPVATGSTLSGYTYISKKIKYGTYVVTITKEGYKDFTQTVVLNADDVTVDAKLESVNEVKAELDKAHKVTDTTVQVDFTNKIAVPTKDNFSIEGLTIEDVKLTDDQKSVILTVAGMELDKTYSVKTNNIIDANGNAVNNGTVDFVARKISYKVDMQIVDVNTGKDITQIKSDGKETAKFVVTLYDDAGEVVKDSKAEVRFTTTAGNFAETKVTAQSGVAANIFTSEISATKKDALVTATVVAADNKDLINLEAKRTLSMSPVIDTDDSAATLTDVLVETCDRVILYFNKDVNATDYTVNKPGKTYKYDPDKMEIKIADNAGTLTTVEQCEEASKTDTSIHVYQPLALAPVPGETKALYAILDTDKNAPDYLTDNARAIVKVTDNTKAISATDTKITNVTDIRTPSILDAKADGLRSVKVTFSEPVQNGDKLTNSAEQLKKWRIDSTDIDDARWGSNKSATAKVGKFDIDTAVDKRNEVTITLGTDEYGEQKYFTAGNHSVQGDKIGDWANVTDTGNNINNTQSLDFVVENDDTAPKMDVTVESPEQFALKFNTPVGLDDLNDNLELQKKNDKEWVKLDKSLIKIRPVANTDEKEYIVELAKDWTDILDTYNTKQNYYNFNFRLYIKKGVITNLSNGLPNEEIECELNDKIMKTADVTSAELSGVYKDDNTVVIDVSEPVQIALKDENGELSRTLTPTIEQKKAEGGELSLPIVQFISEGEKETIKGTIESISEHDNQITVKPDKTITTGKWKVVVRNVSDDVGNTSPTLVKDDFIVDKPIVNDDFKVLWVVGVKGGKKDDGTVIKKDNPITPDVEADLKYPDDVIYVKFNKEIKTTGGTLNAGATTNYTVNGYTLPTDTKIENSIVDIMQTLYLRTDTLI